MLADAEIVADTTAQPRKFIGAKFENARSKAVMSAVGSLQSHAKLSQGECDIVGDHTQIGALGFVELQNISHGAAGVIHVRCRLDNEYIFGAVFSFCKIVGALPCFPAGRIFKCTFERIDDGKADVMACAVVSGAGVTESDKYFQDFNNLTQRSRSATLRKQRGFKKKTCKRILAGLFINIEKSELGFFFFLALGLDLLGLGDLGHRCCRIVRCLRRYDSHDHGVFIAEDRVLIGCR